MASAEQQDWRLEARVRAKSRSSLDHIADDTRAAVGPDVVVTMDGSVLFAYGATQSTVDAAREAIEDVLRRDRLDGSVLVSHWDPALEDWRQVDPPPSAALEAEVAREAGRVITQTFVCVAGKLVRAQIERTMLESARIHGVQCEIAEHPHMLTTQVSFTVTGPEHRLDDFRTDLHDQAFATIRADALTMNPTA
jgi:hypothetical protein